MTTPEQVQVPRQVLISADVLERILDRNADAVQNATRLCDLCDAYLSKGDMTSPLEHDEDCPSHAIRAALATPIPAPAAAEVQEVEGMRAALNGSAETHNPYVFGPEDKREAWAKGCTAVWRYGQSQYVRGADAVKVLSHPPVQAPAAGAEADIARAHKLIDERTKIVRHLPGEPETISWRVDALTYERAKLESALKSSNKRGQDWKKIALAHGASSYILDHEAILKDAALPVQPQPAPDAQGVE